MSSGNETSSAHRSLEPVESSMLDLQLQDRVYVLRLQNAENRLNRASLDAWNAALDRVEQSDIPTALVTTGECKFYSNGLDLNWMAEAGTEAATENVQRVHELLARMLTFPVITVAALNGHAFAAGAMLALAHDFRVMRADRGFFCLPEVDLGIPFTATMQSLIRARLPKTTAHEACVTGRRYGGEQAVVRGIVDQAETELEVLPKALALAKSLAGKNRATLSTIKRSAYAQVLAAVTEDRGKGLAPNMSR
jgi:enoyl-CoA hydratase/carnithine racemase